MTVILEDNLASLLQRIISCFQRERVPYVLIGAWALAAWGRPRATNDLDFLILVNDLDRLKGRLTQAELKLDETWYEWNPMLRGSQFRFHFHGLTVDILLPRGPHDQQIFQRKRKKCMDGHYYWVVCPEDFILQKLKVGRPRDFEDTASVTDRLREKLDRKYLEHWAKQLGVMEELRYILDS